MSIINNSLIEILARISFYKFFIITLCKIFYIAIIFGINNINTFIVTP